MIYGHGDDGYNYPEVKDNFSSNARCDTNLSGLKNYLTGKLDLISSYPEPDAASLATEIARQAGVSPEAVCITNGATEAFYLLAGLQEKGHSLIPIPTFGEYADACALSHHTITYISQQEETLPTDSDMVWICNPNNPDGQVHSGEKLRRWIETHPNTLFILDHSYEAFTEETLFSIPETKAFPQVITVHSLTKQYGIPGLRLGYITAAPEIIRQISTRKMPWSVNALALEAGKYILSHPEEFQIDIRNLLQEKDRFSSELSTIEGIKVYPSHTHFFLISLGRNQAKDLKKYLVEKEKILIRDASNFKGLDPGYIRVCTLTPEVNNRFVNALKKWMHSVTY